MTRIDAPWLTDAASQTVCAMLNDAGHQALFVGGCVRDALLGVPVSDLDISTDALPDTVMAMAKGAGLKVVPTGIDHGTVTVICDDIPFEITTFRRDVKTDGRRAVVAFSTDIAEDARRRDFTMNALYAGADGVVIDPLGGLPDLNAGRVRFIEDADQRIAEDYLRVLRFFRFTAFYGDPVLGIDADGLAACAAGIDGIDTLSAERIGQEMLKLLTAPDPGPAVAAMAACGALLRVLPGAAPDVLPVMIHVEDAQDATPDPIRRLAILGGETDRLRLSKKQAMRLELLQSEMPPATLAYHHGADLGLDRLMIEAASLGQMVDPADIHAVTHAATQTFPLTAADLMPDVQGAALGGALKEAEARWIASGFTLTKDELLA